MRKIHFIKGPTRITILKKNQVILGTIALMLIVAGYLNYSTTKDSLITTSSLLDSEEVAGIGDAVLVSSDSIIEQEEMNLNSTNTEIGDAVQTSNLENKNENELPTDYFTKSRLERQTMYSQMIEEYKKILENNSMGNEQKAISQNEMIKLNNTQNAIMIVENLIKIKGFEDLIVFANNDSINVVIKAEKLSTEQVAQIQNIICREMGVEIKNIHITTK